jgi:hypothetical protein
MSWKKHFTLIPQNRLLQSQLDRNSANSDGFGVTGNKFSSYLPEVYSGPPNRIERYSQYYAMDQDSEVCASLDTIADFMTQQTEEQPLPFRLVFNDDATSTEVRIAQEALKQWCRINEFKRRIWKIVRNTILYGDQFFIRDPETLKWNWVDHTKVDKVVVDEANGKKLLQYIIRDIDLNLQTLVATSTTANPAQYPTGLNTNQIIGITDPQVISLNPLNAVNKGGAGRFDNTPSQSGVDARLIIHLSMSEGLDSGWPFGNSILDAVFKVFKQKELLEDAVIIYRVQRAPERRVFYIDVGTMPPHRAMAHIERVKNEIHQRRIPNRTGSGALIGDAAYNPMSILDDFFLAQTADGRGSKIDTLPAGENLGQIDDLRYFNNKMMRGLRVPPSYIPSGPDDGTQSYSDGRVGTAYMQELRFANYCERLQRLISPIFDREFKIFLELRGIDIEANVFEVAFNKPENFAKYRQIELDSAQLALIANLFDVPFISKRFVMERYMNLTVAEMQRNQELWTEENEKRIRNKTSAATGASLGGGSGEGLGSIGISSTPSAGPAAPGPELTGAEANAPIEGGETGESPGVPGATTPGGPGPGTGGAEGNTLPGI